MLDPPRTETGHDDDGERRQGERFWVEQERLADEEKAERAREMLDRMRQKEIEQQRMTAGLCMCWKRAGVPGKWNNRFKNAWEPIFHFSRTGRIKIFHEAVAHETKHAFDYSPANGKSISGSGLLGKEHAARFKEGLACASNVLEIGTGGAKVSGEHPAEYPVALPEFFIKAFTGSQDVVFDPFSGSGSTLIAAEKKGRCGVGVELSPAYCDVTVRRWHDFAGSEVILEGDGRTFAEVTTSRHGTTKAAREAGRPRKGAPKIGHA
jgi:hypothetical protein